MNNIFLIIGIFVWIVFGIISYGSSFAFWQKTYPNEANEFYEKDIIISLIIGLFGPIGLFGLCCAGIFGCGMKFK